VRTPNLASGLLLILIQGSAGACGTESDPLGPPVDPDDVDGDGILNDADICPSSYDPEQHDEDGDGIGDACDVCPTIADPDQADTGELGNHQFGDRIGDACDPRFNRDGDRAIRFDPFASDTSARWTGAGFTIDLDAAHATADARFRNPQAVQGDGLFVQLHVTSLVWNAVGRVEAVVDGDGLGSGLTCAVVRDTDGDGNDEIEATEIGVTLPTSISLGRSVTADVTITAWRVIGPDRTGTFLCRVRHGSGLDREIQLDLPEPFPSGPYAFASSGATTAVGSVIVYTFPISPCAFSAGRPDCPPPD
jgi:hypothetical protein